MSARNSHVASSSPTEPTQPIRLLVNVDHVATLRNARGEGYPDPAEAAVLCEAAGAAGIVFHLRGDRRHIRDHDLPRLKRLVRGRLDFEMAATDEMIGLCVELKPALCTLVPEGREELTTEGGLDMEAVAGDFERRVFPALRGGGVEVSLFVDPVERDVRLSADLGAGAIELHTGTFANAFASGLSRTGRDAMGFLDADPTPGATSPMELDVEGLSAQVRDELDRLREAAILAHGLGLHVHAGHGLNRVNLPLFLSHVPHLRELSIGHALVSESLRFGLEGTVRRYLDILSAHAAGNRNG